jgi:hypothetical protein
MSPEPESPFDSLDGTFEYIGLLCAKIAETRLALIEDVEYASREAAARRLEALRLVSLKLDQLERHVNASRGLLNDLRLLRRLLLREAPGSNPRRTDSLRTEEEATDVV